MFYDSDWLLAELEKYQVEKRRSPLFVSDWDCFPDESNFMGQIVLSSLASSKNHSQKYSYSEDQLTQRELVADYVNKNGRLQLSAGNISVASNATNALYLSLQALDTLGIRRFLVITPVYYSVIETLVSMKSATIFYHLCDKEKFEFDLEKIQSTIDEQEIDAMIFTDPIYSAGVEVSKTIYENLSDISDRFGVWLICDHALGGLPWETSLSLLDVEKVNILQSIPRFIYIDSITKRLFINGLKHAIIVAPESIINLTHDLACRISGGLCGAQFSLLEELFAPRNESDILDFMSQNQRKIKSQYQLLQGALNGTQFSTYSSNSSCFSMICHKSARVRDVDSKRAVKRLLYEHDLYVLPSEHFHFSKNSRFGFRINLINDMSMSLPVVIDALSYDTDFLCEFG